MWKTFVLVKVSLIIGCFASCSWRSQPSPCDCLKNCGTPLPFPAPPHLPPFDVFPPPPCFNKFPSDPMEQERLLGFPTHNTRNSLPFVGPLALSSYSWMSEMGKLRNPLVLPLIHGNFSGSGTKLSMHPSVVLIIDEKPSSSSSERRFILVDTGLSLLKHSVIAGLLSHRVDPAMIDTVIITHSDTDTMGNLNLFPCAEVFSSNRIAKENFFIQQTSPTFDGNRSDLPFHKLYDNTELYLTPGFGLQDHSLVVRNVENHGTVAIVGKLVLNETDLVSSNMAIREFAIDDGEQRKLWQATRREIVCLADYIIPGHGMPFKVSDELKRLAECHKKESEKVTVAPQKNGWRKWKSLRNQPQD